MTYRLTLTLVGTFTTYKEQMCTQDPMGSKLSYVYVSIPSHPDEYMFILFKTIS